MFAPLRLLCSSRRHEDLFPRFMIVLLHRLFAYGHSEREIRDSPAHASDLASDSRWACLEAVVRAQSDEPYPGKAAAGQEVVAAD